MGTFNKHNASWYDKVFVLSEFHKSLLPSCVDKDKVIVTRNGIDLSQIPSGLERQKNKLVYTSSYDRGLENLLDVWADVKKEVPDAELHIYYGWNTYDKMVQMGMRTPEFKEYMTKKMAQDGVFEHGRIGQDELAKVLSEADVFAYPSHFEEISCISVMRAQACGCIPVTTDYAALAETNKYGIKVHGKGNEVKEAYKNALIESLKTDYVGKRKIMVDNKAQFGWAGVAQQWSRLF
jgi:glycosyltransferase involved in cell wall biosynthesis